MADNTNHVMSFYPPNPRPDGLLQEQRIGWRRASTFDAFCDKHDASTFSRLEQHDFTGSAEQIFLIAYRAVCWELYRKEAALRGGSVLRTLLDRGQPPSAQHRIQRFLAVQDAGFQKGIEDLRTVKGTMDNALLARDYQSFKTWVVSFEGDLQIASTGGVTPNRSLSGTSLQVLHEMDAESQWLTFGVDIGRASNSVIFLWSADASAPQAYLREVMGLDDKRLENFLPQFFFAHCENTYFSPSWWDGLGQSGRRLVRNLASNPNPYYFDPAYELDHRLTTWRVLRR